MSQYPYIPLIAYDLDINNDGLINQIEVDAVYKALGSHQGDPLYNIKLDSNLNGVVDQNDADIIEKRAEAGISLETIRNNIRTGEKAEIEPGIWLNAVNPDNLIWWFWWWCKTTVFHPPKAKIWGCVPISLNQFMAAYKALGYGVINMASSVPHAYLGAWTGGDWHDLNNWYIIDHYLIIEQATNPILKNSYYETIRFGMPIIRERSYRTNGGYGDGWVRVLKLEVDFDLQRVEYLMNITGYHPGRYGLWEDTGPDFSNFPYGDYYFVTDLGLGNHLVCHPAAATEITEESAQLNGLIGEVPDNYNANIRGFEWDSEPIKTQYYSYYRNGHIETGDFNVGLFSHTITNLEPGKTYYYRTKAHYDLGWVYGPELNFTTSKISAKPGLLCPAIIVGTAATALILSGKKK